MSENQDAELHLLLEGTLFKVNPRTKANTSETVLVVKMALEALKRSQPIQTISTLTHNYHVNAIFACEALLLKLEGVKWEDPSLPVNKQM